MKSYLLTFKTVKGEDYTIKIDDANEMATPEEIKSAMEKMINTKIVISSKGRITEIVKAEIFELVETVFAV